jgi:ecotin
MFIWHISDAITTFAANSRRLTMLHANRINALVFLIVLAGLTGSYPTAANAADDLKPYPEAESGYRRAVIRLPVVDAPDDRKVELIFGKMMEIDCNRHFFSAQLARKVAQGWGYDYFVMSNIRGPASTMMACPPDEPKKNTFVRVGLGQEDAQNGWQHYNPKLPIVVYVPEGIEVRYRIWKADEQAVTAPSE